MAHRLAAAAALGSFVGNAKFQGPPQGLLNQNLHFNKDYRRSVGISETGEHLHIPPRAATYVCKAQILHETHSDISIPMMFSSFSKMPTWKKK